MDTVFEGFPKIARLNRECIITEKIDGTNSSVVIDETGLVIRAGSKSRWITPTDDNFGFAKWVDENRAALLTLGPGRHFGEWWGSKIQRKYGLQNEKRFSLFNTSRWVKQTDWASPPLLEKQQYVPACCHVVPVLYEGLFTTSAVTDCIQFLRNYGSCAAPGFMKPEGVVIFHTHGNYFFKATLDHDEVPKSLVDKQGKV